MTQITKIELHKTADIYENNSLRISTITKSFKQCLSIIQTANVSPILSITWKVVYNAPTTITKQNKTMLRRANKIAEILGRNVEAIAQLDKVTYGVALV